MQPSQHSAAPAKRLPPNAGKGRKPGQQAMTKLTKVMRQARDQLAEWAIANPHFNVLAKLQEVAETTAKDADRIVALSLIARYSCAIPAPAEERAVFKLPDELNTPEQVANCLAGVAVAVAAGEMPSKQADALSKVLALRMDAMAQARLQHRVETLEKKVAPPVDTKTLVAQQALVTSVAPAPDFDPNPAPKEISDGD